MTCCHDNRSNLANISSVMYAMLTIIIGLVLAVGEALQGQWMHSYYNGVRCFVISYYSIILLYCVNHCFYVFYYCAVLSLCRCLLLTCTQ